MSIDKSVFKKKPATIICVDLGSFSIKAGYVGLDVDTGWMPDITQRPVVDLYKHRSGRDKILSHNVDEETEATETTVGKRLLEAEIDSFSQQYNFESVEAELSSILSQLLSSTEKDNSAFIFADAVSTSINDRCKLMTLSMEKFQCAGVYFVNQPILCAYANGRTTTTVLDCGFSQSVVTNIYDGIIDRPNVRHYALSGKHVTHAVANCLQLHERHLNNRALANSLSHATSKIGYEDMILTKLKREKLFVSKNIQKDREKSKSGSQIKRLELPDKSWITVDQCQYEGPEILFAQNTYGTRHVQESGNIVDMMMTNALRAKTPLTNVVFAGGTSMIPFFDAKIKREIISKSRDDEGKATLQVNIDPPTKRKPREFSAWAGGAIFAGISTMQGMLITKEEYFEYGADAIVPVRCIH
jgi:actin, alpha cardiac muscle